MGINIQAKTDYSSLFSSLNSGSSSSNSLSSLISGGILSDYAQVKSGTYGKLMKAYYAKDGANDAVSSIVDTKKTTKSEDATELTEIRSVASSLKETTDKMVESDFEDADENLNNVKNFVNEYNSMMKKIGSSSILSISSKSDNLVSLTKNYEKNLNSIGITIGEDNKLKLDTDTFKKADASTVKELFSGIGSYGYSVSNQATIVDNQAAYEGLKTNTYTASGSYGASATGSVWDSLI